MANDSSALNWNDRQYVICVARTGSYFKASSLLNTNPSTVTRRVRRLETALGVKIFRSSCAWHAIFARLTREICACPAPALYHGPGSVIDLRTRLAENRQLERENAGGWNGRKQGTSAIARRGGGGRDDRQCAHIISNLPAGTARSPNARPSNEVYRFLPRRPAPRLRPSQLDNPAIGCDQPIYSN